MTKTDYFVGEGYTADFPLADFSYDMKKRERKYNLHGMYLNLSLICVDTATVLEMYRSTHRINFSILTFCGLCVMHIGLSVFHYKRQKNILKLLTIHKLLQ